MPKPSKGKALTDKQKIFVAEYVSHWNATRAAIAAGYSKKSAHYQGSENLAKPAIKAEIERVLATKGMIIAEILARLTDQARGNFMSFVSFEPDGLIHFDFSTDEAKDNMHLIKKIKTRRALKLVEGEEWETEWVEIELYDAQRALELLAKAYGLFRDVSLFLNMGNLTKEQLELVAKNGAPIRIVEYEIHKAYEGDKADQIQSGSQLIDIRTV